MIEIMKDITTAHFFPLKRPDATIINMINAIIQGIKTGAWSVPFPVRKEVCVLFIIFIEKLDSPPKIIKAKNKHHNHSKTAYKVVSQARSVHSKGRLIDVSIKKKIKK
jgi:hypothetical protein